ncbi:thermonuclease family protein [Henriciella barbarensis]|uniref:Thermonuclease family protein n=2 Tax=Henriciella barbarensis TaxID=86342 RepID=A0A399QXM7_9PROT|nr:thermonuclease family protein [Henriciella barbarensis]
MTIKRVGAFGMLGFVIAGCSVGSTAAEPAIEELAGVASVIDGDTIEIHGKRVRLSGYDTPERGARCGDVNVYQQAALALSDFIGSRTVTCDVSGEDRWDRAIAVCDVAGVDIGEFMVSTGWGRDWPRYSDGRYADEEARAREAGANVWSPTCPADLWGDRSYD